MLQIIHGNKKGELLEKILNRSVLATKEIEEQTRAIINQVRESADEAIRFYTKEFDQANVAEFLVTETEFEEAFEQIDEELLQALKAAKDNIVSYHQHQLATGFEIKTAETTLKQLVSPIEKIGVYVPGGKAAYPSTVLMNVIPAKIAGVTDITMVTPPNKEGKIKGSLLVAARLVGVNRVLKIGGAQSIAALAYGTDTIDKVDKIVGPGNAYVAMAKKLVSGDVGIDMIAGPTEVVVLADETANPRFIVADLMAQAEHDEMASSIVVTTSLTLAKAVQKYALEMSEQQPRKAIIQAAFTDYGGIIVTETMDEAIGIVNQIAPEHLEILAENEEEICGKIKHAGAIFLGQYTPEPVGDYYGGTNHTLPTNQTARFSSPLNVNDFQKKTSVVRYSKKALANARNHIELIAEEEGLQAHKYAITIRFEEEQHENSDD